jgi:hypothetical protein
MAYKYTYINIAGDTATTIQSKLYIPYKGNKGRPETDLDMDTYDAIKRKPIKITAISLCNIHASDSVNVDLYAYHTQINQSNDPSIGQVDESNSLDVVADTYSTYYFLKNVTIPNGVTLHLDENDVCYDNAYYDLYIKLNASDSAVDVIIKY